MTKHREERKKLISRPRAISVRLTRNMNTAATFLIRKGYPLLCEPVILCFGAALEDTINLYIARSYQHQEKVKSKATADALMKLQMLDIVSKWSEIHKVLGKPPVPFSDDWHLALAVRNEIAHNITYEGSVEGLLRPGLLRLEAIGVLAPPRGDTGRFREGRFNSWELVKWIALQFNAIVQAFAQALDLDPKKMGEEYSEFEFIANAMPRELNTDRNPPYVAKTT